MFMVNQLAGFGAGGEGPATIAWTDSDVDGVYRTSYTFSDVGLGSPAANRQIIVGAVIHDASTPQKITTMTIDGIAAGRVAWAVNSEIGLDFWSAEVPNNTTGQIVVTLAGEANRCGIGVWAV